MDRLPANRIVAVATPDYTVTPMGRLSATPPSRTTIARFNGVLRSAAEIARHRVRA